MSEIFHRKGIATERTLAILSFEDGTLDQRPRLAESIETRAFFLPSQAEQSRRAQSAHGLSHRARARERSLVRARQIAVVATGISPSRSRAISRRPPRASRANISSAGWIGTATTSSWTAASSTTARSASSAFTTGNTATTTWTACRRHSRAAHESPLHRPELHPDRRLPHHRHEAQHPALQVHPLLKALRRAFRANSQSASARENGLPRRSRPKSSSRSTPSSCAGSATTSPTSKKPLLARSLQSRRRRHLRRDFLDARNPQRAPAALSGSAERFSPPTNSST